MLKRSRIRVALLCSHRAPGLAYLLDHDPNRGRLYDVVCCLSSNEGFEGQKAAERHDTPCLARPIRSFYRERGLPITDLGAREAYDAALAQTLAPFAPDLLVLAGYLYVLTGPILGRFPDRILNLHHGDLTLTDHRGRPRYAGLRAVRDAVFAGERETRATAHLVGERVDEGPLLLRSWSFPVAPLVREALAWRAVDVLKAYAFAHQEWMLRSAWGPMLAAGIELLGTGRARILDEWAWIDGLPGPMDLPADGILRTPAPSRRSRDPFRRGVVVPFERLPSQSRAAPGRGKEVCP